MQVETLTFRVGNTRIIVMENFEALGRYTAAKDQAETFLMHRDNALKQLSGAALKGVMSGYMSGRFAEDFNVPKAQEALKNAIEANDNMLSAIDEANRNANDCGKPELKVFK